MRDSGSPQALSTLFVFYLLAFVASVIWSIVAVPDVLAVFRWPYIWASAFTRFVDYAIPVTVSALAVAFSLFVRRRGGPRQPFYRLVSSQLTLMITLAILYTVVLLGFYPRSRAQLSALQELTREGRAFLEAAKKARQAEDEEEALANYDRYLAIDKRNREVIEQRDQLRQAMLKDSARRRESAAEPAKQATAQVKELAEGKQAVELIQMAQGFFDKEDYFSAHYYASLAARLDPRRSDATRLAAKAWDKIRGLELSKMEKDKRQLFEAKKRGHELFQQEDYIAAYYHFLDMAQRYPGDADAERYLARSRERVSSEIFFLDEAQKIEYLPGDEELLFVNPRQDGLREIVAIGKMATSLEGTFFKDIEVLRFGERGLEVHFRAPYGKLAEGGQPGGMDILLHGIDRASRAREALPRYLAGSERRREPRNLLPLSVDRGALSVLRGRPDLSGLGVAALWQVRDKAARYGHGEYALALELLMRLLLPFVFLNLSLLAAALGWSYRFTSLDRPPILAYLFIPAFPVATALITTVFLKAHRILAGFALLAWSFRTALFGLAVLQGAILALMLILLAGQRTD